MREKLKNLFYSLIILYLAVVFLRWIKLEIQGINRESLLKLSYFLGGLLTLLYSREILSKAKMYLDKNRVSSNEIYFKKSAKDIYSKIKQFLSKKLIRLYLIPLFLLFLGVELTLASLSLSGEKLHILSQNLPLSSINKNKIGELLSGDKITGEFVAKENNLGTFALSFVTFNRQNTGSIRFMIREKINDNWFYSNEYPLSKVPPQEFFPFGFPKISDSKGKDYIWEIISVDGQPGNAVGLNQINLPIKLKYEFDKKSVIKNPLNFIIFSFSKIKGLIFEEGYLPYLIIFFAPLLFYFSGFIILRYKFAKYFYPFITLILVFIEIFVVKSNNDFVFLTISIIWLITCLFFRYSGKISISVGLFFLMLIPIFLINNNEIMAEKVGIWAYLFLLCGTIIFIASKEKNRKNGNEK